MKELTLLVVIILVVVLAVVTHYADILAVFFLGYAVRMYIEKRREEKRKREKAPGNGIVYR